MAMRWKKNPRPAGLAGVCAGPQGSKLRDGEEELARTQYIDLRSSAMSGRSAGWFWCALSSSELGIAHKNTCNEPVATEEEAKAQAMAYIREQMKANKK